jgi:hypothetical protein
LRRALNAAHECRSARLEAALGGISLPADYSRTNARGKTLARNYQSSLEEYIMLDVADGRQFYDAGVRQPVVVAGETLNVYMDALVYKLLDHTARIALWDVPRPSVDEASVMASPVIDALELAVGEERAHSVAFWHLRSGTVIEIDSDSAHAKAAVAADAVRRAAGV